MKATVDKNRKGFAFLKFEGVGHGYEDAFVPPRDAAGLFHGDRVEVTIARGEVIGVRVLAHRFRELVGRFERHPSGRGGWVVYERKRAREEVFLPEADPRVKPGDWVRVQLKFHESGPHAVTAVVKDVFGAEIPPSADVAMIAAEYSLVEEHGQAAEAEARAAKLEVPGRDLEGREDLRGVPFITIDGETARDFDDAVFVERAKSGYVLWVGIADVSHYVRPGTALDDDARERGTSVYFPERAFHMLPRALSENLCSLRPREPRLALVARMEIDREGRRRKTEILDAVIESRRRATYNEIQAEYEARGRDRDWELAPHFELFESLRAERTRRGALDFELPEAELKVRPTGEVDEIKLRPRLAAHRLIEEFMISANEGVTEWMRARGWPFVYRVHAEPTVEALAQFAKLAASVGVQVHVAAGIKPKALAELLHRLEGHPAQALLNTALLRSMKQAVYSAEYGIHFGLASEGYTHFTSPIRRYPDLVVHRLLRQALRVDAKRERRPTNEEIKHRQDDLVGITEHCSYRERLAADAERESIKLKQTRLMVQHLGDEFEGHVTGMLESGFFVQLADPYVEGMVPNDSLAAAPPSQKRRHVGHGGGERRKPPKPWGERVFRVGEKVRVRVVRADVDRRQIDFELLRD